LCRYSRREGHDRVSAQSSRTISAGSSQLSRESCETLTISSQTKEVLCRDRTVECVALVK
jgi:hypothetical protein